MSVFCAISLATISHRVRKTMAQQQSDVQSAVEAAGEAEEQVEA
jgi:cell division protein FtsL